MSLAKHIYVGPFITCSITGEKSNYKQHGCCVQGCSQYHVPRAADCNFCPACGIKLEEYTITVTRPDNLAQLVNYQLVEVAGLPDTLLKDHHVLVPNVRRDPPRNFWLEGDIFFRVRGDEAREEIAWLCSAFAEEIELIRNPTETGLTRLIDFGWGVLSWHH